MKGWLNEKGNWCFELEDEEDETTRFIFLISKGVEYYKERREEYPESYISSELFNHIIGEIFIRQNYKQDNPTIDNPYHYTSKDFLHYEVAKGKSSKPFGSQNFNAKELEIMQTKDVSDIL